MAFVTKGERTKMSKYIDANRLIFKMYGSSILDGESMATMHRVIQETPTEDAVPKEEIIDFIINKVTDEVSERIIKFLEENYEIIPKKPVVRCKDCMWFDNSCPIQAVTGVVALKEDTCCLFVERK